MESQHTWFESGIMFIEKRPTCVSVIGWAWIVIGGMIVMQVLSITMELAPNEPVGTKWLMGIMSLVICGMYSVPLVIMLRYLRSHKIRRLMRGSMQL